MEFDQDENSFNDTVFILANFIELPDKDGTFPMIENFDGNLFPIKVCVSVGKGFMFNCV